MQRTILVKSCQQFQARQDACHVWSCRIAAAGVPVRFVIGGLVDTFISDRSCVVDSGDGYGDNTIKLAKALTLLLTAEFSHVFVCDDDTFVHPRRFLEHLPEGDFECRLFQPKTQFEIRLNKGSAWATGGAGWWMSRRMAELYIEHTDECHSWDDIMAARIAQQHGLTIVDRPDLYACNRYGGSAGNAIATDNRLITCHPVAAHEMQQLHESTREL